MILPMCVVSPVGSLVGLVEVVVSGRWIAVVSVRRRRRPRRPRRRAPAGRPGRGAGSRAGSRSTISPSRRPGARAPMAMASCSRGSNGVPGAASIWRDALALEQRPQLAIDGRDALDPGVVGDRPPAGRRSPGRSRRRARAPCGSGPRRARPSIASRSSVGPAPVVRELGALALEAGEVLVGLCWAASRSAVSASMSASSFVGETSISSARSWARVRWLMQFLPVAAWSSSGHAWMWATSSFIRPETKRTVPIAWE